MKRQFQSRQYLTIIALAILIFSFSMIVNAQTGTVTDSIECAQRIHSNCRHFIHTVTAMKQMNVDSNGDTSGKWMKNIGTAVPVSADGYLITAHSVVKDATEITITDCEGESFNAVMVGCDVTGRIAVLKTERNYSGNIPAVISLSDIVEGSQVFSLGVVPGMKVEASCGSIKHIHHHDGAIEIVSSSFPGTSGTPVFDTDENLLGIIAYKVDSEVSSGDSKEPESYIALAFDYATVLARRVIEENIPKCGWLGICIDLPNSNNGGIVIKDIIKGSPADQAKILPNDIIYEYNGLPASTISSFSEAFGKSKAGEQVTIKILRGKSRISVDVRLEER